MLVIARFGSSLLGKVSTICYLKWRGPLRVTQSAGYLHPNLPQTQVPAICFILFFSPANTLLGHSRGKKVWTALLVWPIENTASNKQSLVKGLLEGKGNISCLDSLCFHETYESDSLPSLEVWLSSRWSQEPQTIAFTWPQWNCSPPTRKLTINLTFPLSQHLGEFDTQVLLLLFWSSFLPSWSLPLTRWEGNP